MSGFRLTREEIKGFSRTIAEIEWLLLILVLLYLVVEAPAADARLPIITALFLYGAFVVVFHYYHFYREENRLRLAFETWVMIAFITWVVWHSGRLESPLLNLYLLPVITCALTLGKAITLLEVGLVSACYVLLSAGDSTPPALLSAAYGGQLMAQLAPVVLVAYLTTMLSADIHYALDNVRALSETDELTGLLNMRAFTAILSREAERAVRYARPYSLMMVDSDNLKAVNDTYGHETGNRLLTHVVNGIKSVLRSTDVIARYGGDEFVVLLPETGPEGAREVADRVGEAVAATPFAARGERVAVSVSVGVASYPSDGADPREILDKADQAMYRSKEQGRKPATLISASQESDPPGRQQA